MRMSRRLIIYSLVFIFISANIPKKAEASVSVNAQSAILMEQKSGRILFEKDAYTKRRIASITKIMTAILAIESGKMNQDVKVSEQATRAEGSSVYLKPGEKIKLKDLVYGLMLRSGNDAAVTIAEAVGGSVEGFVYLMNQRAKEIGMLNTHFANPHGLDDSNNHYSTAYDMALLTRYAMNNKVYREIVGTKEYRTPNPTENWDRIWKNKNRLLSKYRYTTGGKTGFTKLAKRTLVSTATKGDMSLIAVTLNDPDDWNDHIAMYENGFKNYDMAEVLPKGEIDTGKNNRYNGSLYLKKAFIYPATAKEMNLFRIEYKLKKPPLTKTETVAGKAAIFLDDKLIDKVPVYFQRSNGNKERKGLFSFMKEIFLSFLGVKTDG
ncbi:D-alanyl-D-alanine carboxypeptidase family protein [Bacillota bacterium Lsc_1132]